MTTVRWDNRLERSDRDEGSITALLCVMAMAMFALVGLVVDGGRAVALRSSALQQAGEAARAGAEQLSIVELRSGNVSIDPSIAVHAAQQFLIEAGASGTVTANTSTVTVRVERSEPTAILGLIGIKQMTVSASASASDVHGVTEGD
jgi:hypothetical protein